MSGVDGVTFGRGLAPQAGASIHAPSRGEPAHEGP